MGDGLRPAYRQNLGYANGHRARTMGWLLGLRSLPMVHGLEIETNQSSKTKLGTLAKSR